MDSSAKSNLKRKREHRKWSDVETVQLLDYLREHQEFEKPTARIYYKQFLESTHIDTSWDLVRWKVKYLKSTYLKAASWKESTDSDLLESYESVQGKLKKMCRFYDEMENIFGSQNSKIKLEVFDTSTTSELNFHNSFVTDNSSNDQTEFPGFDCYSEPQLQETALVAIKDEDSLEIEPTLPSSQILSPSTSTSEHSCSQQKIGTVKEIAAKLEKAAPKLSLDQFFQIQTERNECFKMKIEFEQKKFEKELAFKEKLLELQIKERKDNFELKKLEIERDERIRVLELEKKERLERFEIEMRFKLVQK